MPPKVKGLLPSFLFCTLACSATAALAQQPANPQLAISNPPAANAEPSAPTTQQKLDRARALIAARQLPAAVYELEKLKKEISDDAVQSIVRTMLVNVYLEQPNYERAKELLEETFNIGKNRRGASENIYLPIAGQVIKGAHSQLERYKKLGFSLSDPKLPNEAVADLDRWRKMLETICEHSKQMSLDEKRHAESLVVLEEAAEARGALARDEYEAAQWRNTMNDAREVIANAQSKVTDVDGTMVDMKNVATVNLPNNAPSNTVAAPNNAPSVNPNPVQTAFVQPISTTAAQAIVQPTPAATNKNSVESNSSPAPIAAKTETVAPNTASLTAQPSKNADAPRNDAANVAQTEAKATNQDQILKIGSLVDMATRKVNPNYPPMARTARIGGVVKVEVTVDEQGSVTDAKTTEGPELLRRAALDAVRRWKFKPATRDGQPVRMTGFVNFNFAL